MYSICILIYIFKYQWICKRINLHTVYPNLLQMVVEWNLWCTRTWQLSEHRLQSEAEIKHVWWYTSSPFSCQLGGGDQVSLDIYFDAIIMHIVAIILPQWRPWLWKFWDLLSGHIHTNLEVVIVQHWISIRRPWSSKIRDALGGHNHEDLEALIIWVGRYAWRP